MTRILTGALATLVLGAWLLAPASAPNKKASLRCSLTGKQIESCCCLIREGKLYCPLAKKTIDHCCCVPVEQARR